MHLILCFGYMTVAFQMFFWAAERNCTVKSFEKWLSVSVHSFGIDVGG
jgi:hypothetical protein